MPDEFTRGKHELDFVSLGIGVVSVKSITLLMRKTNQI